jgi:hypothetical protein
MQIIGTFLLGWHRCVSERVRTTAQDGCSEGGLLYPAAAQLRVVLGIAATPASGLFPSYAVAEPQGAETFTAPSRSRPEPWLPGWLALRAGLRLAG